MGQLAAIDLGTGRLRWRVPPGSTRDKAPWPRWAERGMPNLGGPLVTASGPVFIGAATDDLLRAFDLTRGKFVWRARLPAGGQASPMSYSAAGCQFVVIAAGGHGGLETARGEHRVAFALRR